MEQAKIKARRALPVTNARQALEAFESMNQYRNAAHNALAQSNRYTAGTTTMLRHYSRYELYDEVADEWEAALGAWLREQAGK